MMIAFRALLIAAWTALAIYTGVVIARHGMDLLPIFFGDIARMTWSGQFNADFSCFLLLSALWTAWRHHFTPVGLGLAILAFFGGAGFLLPYLLLLSIQTRGDMAALLTGRRHAATGGRGTVQ